MLLPALQKASTQGMGKGTAIFASMLQGGIDPLEMLDPAANTLGYAYILAHRSIASENGDEAQVLMPHVTQFTQALKPEQLMGAGDVATLLVKGVVHISELSKDLVWANSSLLRIFDSFRRVHGSENNLTSLHGIVLYHLLRTAHFETAFDWIIRHDIVSADTRISPLVYSDVLQYFYYAGLTLIKLRSYEQACYMLEQCVCSPAQSISVIQMDAYKKLILVQLIHFGKVRSYSCFLANS
jgi:COP9 signalosome complex subunit 3